MSNNHGAEYWCGQYHQLQAQYDALKQRMEEAENAEPAAHMFPSDLERFKEQETFAHAFSVEVGNPDERSVPVYLHPAPANEGYVLVPIEPTDAMLDAVCANLRDDDRKPSWRADRARIYKSMLKAYSEAKEK